MDYRRSSGKGFLSIPLGEKGTANNHSKNSNDIRGKKLPIKPMPFRHKKRGSRYDEAEYPSQRRHLKCHGGHIKLRSGHEQYPKEQNNGPDCMHLLFRFLKEVSIASKG